MIKKLNGSNESIVNEPSKKELYIKLKNDFLNIFQSLTKSKYFFSIRSIFSKSLSLLCLKPNK